MVEAGVPVKALLQGAAPERKQEIEDLWNRYAPKGNSDLVKIHKPLW